MAQGLSTRGLPGAQRRMVGDIAVTTLSDGGFAPGHAPLIGIEKAEYDEIMRANLRSADDFRSGVNAFLVEVGDAKILVKTGTGGAMGPEVNALPGNLAATGIAPEDITHFFVTHMHPDHVGGAMTEGGGVYPNAELILHEAERAFWADEGNFAGAPDSVQTFAEIARGVLSGYGDRMRVIEGEAEVAPGLTAMPLPGHTPGHTRLMVSSGDAQLLIFADIVHVAPVQLARPEVAIGFDVDADQAVATRQRLLDMIATDRLTVAGYHVGFPGVIDIARDGDGYRAVQAHYDHDA